MTTSSLSMSKQLLIGELVKRASHKTPDQDAFVCENKRLTYEELDYRTTQLAGWLQSKGISIDDKVGLLLRNSIEFAEIVYGTALAGGVSVPINFRLGPSEVEYIVNNSDSKILVIGKEFVELIEGIKDRLPKVKQIVVVNNEISENGDYLYYNEIFKSNYNYIPCEQLTDDDAVMIVYTSGTTGKPKGAVLTHKNLFMNAFNIMFEGDEKLFQRQLAVVPFFHIGGITYIIKNCLANGTTIIQREYIPEDVLKTVEKEKITILGLVPTMWNFLMQNPNIDNYDLSTVAICTSGGSLLPLKLKEKIKKYFFNASLVDTFGQTETSQSTTYSFGNEVILKPTSVGRSIINVEIRIVDENMNDVAIGEVGEAVYRGPTIMKEYYKNPEATEEAFKGGWFHSGDLVREDEDGYIYVVDRKKNMIISGGENIYPVEIEKVLYLHEDIYECAVVGIPDEDWGESVKAFIVMKPGRAMTGKEVINHCKQHLASYKKPKYVEFVEELPKNASGKILKHVLSEQK